MFAPLLLLSFSFTLISSQNTRARTQRPAVSSRPEECALFLSNDTIALTRGINSFIEIDNVDVSDGFSLEMDVMPSPMNHNGILFSVGSKRIFNYYEWKTAAVHTQFLVVEFIFSALALTVKAEGIEHLQQIELFRTYPEPYRIDDANWHHIKVYRSQGTWTLKFDHLNTTGAITNKTNVQLYGKQAVIGGRPGYTHHQFQGIIRKLKINNVPITLSGKRVGSDIRGENRFVEV